MIKFKDLYVALTPDPVDPSPEPAKIDVQPARRPGIPIASTGCCAAHSRIFFEVPGEAVEEESGLLEYLKAQLARSDVTMENMQEPSDLQTIADVESLEQKLNVALSELQVRKAELQQAEASASMKAKTVAQSC